MTVSQRFIHSVMTCNLFNNDKSFENNWYRRKYVLDDADKSNEGGRP